MNNGPKVVLDSNVHVSLFIAPGKTLKVLLTLWEQQTIRVVLCPYISHEIGTTLHRPKIHKAFHLNERLITEYLQTLKDRTLAKPNPRHSTIITRDPKDDLILTFSIQQADYLVTGDNDLLAEATNPRVKPLRIMTPQAFVALFS